MSLENRLISAARSAWYGVYERTRVELIHYNLLTNPVVEQLWREQHKPLVSVLIPTFNRAELLLTRALPSVLAQTYTNLEIIVADHGSSDDTGQRVAALGNGRVRLLTVPRKRRYPPTAENHWLAGPVDPLNAALKVARGAWLSRCDDDDEWTPDHVEKLLRFAQAWNYEFVSSTYTRHQIVGPQTIEIANVPAERGIGGTQTWLWRSYLRFMKYNPDCWRRTHDRVNDMDLAERFRRAGVRIGYLPEVTASVMPRPGETHVGSKAYLADPAKTEAAYRF